MSVILAFLKTAFSLVSFSGILSFLGSVLDFFTTPLGQAAAIALAIAISFSVGDIHRGRVDKAYYARLTAQEVAREQAIRQLAAKAAQAQNDQLEKSNAELQQKVTDYETAIAARKGGVCALSADDVKRLRGIVR